jgi:hypothetical protein
MATEILKADTRKTTALLKKLLKQKFGIDASVRSEYYSGGSSLRISYQLGPDESVINSIVKNLQYGYFDGMTDEYKGVKTDPVIVDGYQLNDYKYVFVKQEISRDFKSKLATLIRKHIPTSRSGREDDDAMVWDIKPRNFVTQDESLIQLRSIDFTHVDYTVLYSIKGEDKIYSTREEPKTCKAPKSAPVEVVTALTIEGEDQITFVPYSEKSFALIGLGTKAIKDQLVKYGSYNRHLKCGAGWIFSNKHEATIRTLLPTLNKPTHDPIPEQTENQS